MRCKQLIILVRLNGCSEPLTFTPPSKIPPKSLSHSRLNRFVFTVQIYNFLTGFPVHLFTTLLAMDPSTSEEISI